MRIESVCVFLGSANATREPLHRLARAVGAALARAGLTVVYGGANCGLMGDLANAALALGGRVVGVIPRQLVEREVAHERLSELVVVDSMHQRKAEMTARSDALVVLPGGFGTLDEAFEALTWRYLGLHHKPVIFVDPPEAPFWDPLFAWARTALDSGLVRHEHLPKMERIVGAPDLLARLEGEAPHPGEPPAWI